MKATSWLLLLFSLPTNRNTVRVAVWRRLKKMGAVQIKTSTYLLPDEPAQYEQFQWLAKQIRDYGGDSTLVRAQEIEGLTREKVVSLFDSARGHEVAMLLRRAEGPKRSPKLQTLDGKEYREKTWLTRPRPEIDRVGSAWLISKFIDPKAKFVFAPTAQAVPEAIPFDMLDAEFTHHGNGCTFKTFTKRFAIADKAIAKIGEMIHDADLDDAKFQRVECVGIDRVFKGWAKEGLPDEEILRRGFECFDALYAFLQRR